MTRLGARAAIATLVVVITLAIGQAPAAARSGHDFRLCATVSTTERRCYNGGVTYESGQTVHLRGRITPACPGFGQVLRQAPGQRRFEVVGTMGVDRHGRIRWSWPTRDRHVDGGRPYLFAFRIPGVGRSNLVEVWVVPRHG